MNGILLAGIYPGVDLHHVRMHFSREVSEAGTVRLRKVGHLFAVIFRIVVSRLRFRTTVLYYPPAGPFVVPIIRDLALLLATRWMFRAVILHFHAGGLSSAYDRFGPILRAMCRLAYFNCQVGVQTSTIAPPDAASLHARIECIVPNGLPDRVIGQPKRGQDPRVNSPAILYVGAVRESKG